MSITGPPGEPSKVGVALVDVIAGLYATTAVLAALLERERSGAGQRVTIDLMHTALAALANQATGWLSAGAVPVALGNVHPSIEPFATYRARDGQLMICAGQRPPVQGVRRRARDPGDRRRPLVRDQLGAGGESRRTQGEARGRARR